MAGYVIAIVDVTNAGEWPGPRTVILEFPSLARALEWYASPEYAPLQPIRQANSRADIAFFEGVTNPAD